MNKTLEDIKSGRTKLIKELKLATGLRTFPEEIFLLKDTLEVLDLSNNEISELPDDIVCLSRLKILFISNNQFEVFPPVLGKCESLDIIGFKANKISIVPENSIPKNLRWLILTDNKIKKLPASIGHCLNLQKVMLAGNSLIELPLEMVNCKKIELLRIAANQLTELPQWLFSLPNLTWLAFSGNTIANSLASQPNLTKFDWHTIELQDQLGQGASGIIYKGKIKGQELNAAIKIFKGEVTSDGWPHDEMLACIEAGNHENIIRLLGKIENHPDAKQGLVFELLPSNFKTLGLPPNFITCTRDTFLANTTFSIETINKISHAMATALNHLHSKGIMHGDFYAHNILIDPSNNVLLSDFGAATLYDRSNLALSGALERFDVKAFGFLLEDLLLRTNDKEHTLFELLNEIKDECVSIAPRLNPTFSNVLTMLTGI